MLGVLELIQPSLKKFRQQYHTIQKLLFIHDLSNRSTSPDVVVFGQLDVKPPTPFGSLKPSSMFYACFTFYRCSHVISPTSQGAHRRPSPTYENEALVKFPRA